MNLGPVHLDGFTLSIDDQNNCPSAIGPRDLTGLIADVNLGSTYTLKYKITDCDPATDPWPTLSGAWIDYNQDGIFDDWEQIGLKSETSVVDVAIDFVVPFSTVDHEVLPGNTYLRVQVQETNAEYLDPCAHFAWGGTKDFTIRIWEPKNYCVSGPLSTSQAGLGAVTLIGETKSINDPPTPCANLQPGPVDRTSLIADVYIAKPYTITYNVVTCGAQSTTQSNAWVDYNQNEIFETWEQITPRSSAFGTVSYSFKVPPSAPDQVVVAAPTRLRVQVQQSTDNKSLDPCAQFQYGGTRDYTLNILNNTMI